MMNSAASAVSESFSTGGISLEQRVADFEHWAETVRDPASARSEGLRRIISGNRKAVAEYTIAELPDGQWAIRIGCFYQAGDYFGRSVPWQARNTRQECIDCFLETARKHFGSELIGGCCSEAQRQARKQMLELLSETGLFGFIEPPPESE